MILAGSGVMAAVGQHPQQNGVSALVFRLHPGGKLLAVIGRHVVVQLPGLDVGRRIVCLPHVVVGGVTEQVLKHLPALPGVAVLGDVHGAPVVLRKVNHIRVRQGNCQPLLQVSAFCLLLYRLREVVHHPSMR